MKWEPSKLVLQLLSAMPRVACLFWILICFLVYIFILAAGFKLFLALYGMLSRTAVEISRSLLLFLFYMMTFASGYDGLILLPSLNKFNQSTHSQGLSPACFWLPLKEKKQQKNPKAHLMFPSKYILMITDPFWEHSVGQQEKTGTFVE